MIERARSFGTVAAAYAEHRPGYSSEAVAWALAPAPGPDVLDLGAGTGKLTEALVSRAGARVIAVEPDPAMLAQLRLLLPDVDAREGTAEAIPLPDASVDAVLAGAAMHWFDLDRALPEIARVLRPGGVLAGLWNGDDAGVDWVAGHHLVVQDHVRAPAVGGDREMPLPGFTGREQASFPHLVPTSAEGLIASMCTQSWALVADPADRDTAIAAVRAYLAARPETSSGTFDMPLRIEVIRAVRSSLSRPTRITTSVPTAPPFAKHSANEERARSFGAAADDYVKHRPGYPAAAIRWALAPAPGRAVLDLAAGTGKLTASLVDGEPGAYDVVAVEPDPEMLARLRVELPDIDARHGAAEDIPLPDGSVDAVLVGQAVHWFDMERALPEIARVLRPGGVLAGLWNGEDHTVEWVAGYHRVVDMERRVPGTSDGLGGDPFRGGLFAPSEHAAFPNPVTTTIDGLIATISTHSWALVTTRPTATPCSPGCAATSPPAPRPRRESSCCRSSPTCCARCAGRPAAARAASGRARTR